MRTPATQLPHAITCVPARSRCAKPPKIYATGSFITLTLLLQLVDHLWKVALASQQLFQRFCSRLGVRKLGPQGVRQETLILANLALLAA